MSESPNKFIYVDEQVIRVAEAIDANIDAIKDDGFSRDLASKNILSDLRAFVEHVALQISCRESGKDFTGPTDEYKKIEEALKFISKQAKYRFLNEFHLLLNRTNSHYVTNIEEGARLLLHYLDYLSQIREFELSNYGISILDKLKQYPRNLDDTSKKFYEAASTAYQKEISEPFAIDDAAYYILSKKAIRGFGQSIYELVLAPANDYVDKFNRFTVFTGEDVFPYYPIKAKFRDGSVAVFGKEVRVAFMKDAVVNIRPCEIKHFFSLCNESLYVARSQPAYKKLMSYIQTNGNTIADVLLMGKTTFAKEFPLMADKSTHLGEALIKMHRKISSGALGSKTVVYLALRMRNATIKSQKLSYGPYALECPFNLSKGVYAFEKTPFCASLISHNPTLTDLTRCFDQNKYRDELFARVIWNHSLKTNNIFMPKDLVDGIPGQEALISQYNNASKTKPEQNIKQIGNCFYIQSNYESTKGIMSAIKSRMGTGVKGYEGGAKAFLKTLPNNRKDDPEKVKIIEELFAKQNVGLIYGPAGTGKSTLISLVCEMFPGVKKIIASNTKASLDHLKRLCKETSHNHYYTIARLESPQPKECDILIVDECSMIENRSMLKVLRQVKCKAMLFAGDTCQLESIGFGNWFAFAKSLFKDSGVHELSNKYRTSDRGLIELWDAVRSCSKTVGPILQRNHYSERLSEKVFERYTEDEIVLCLNYNGIYGINNVNAYLQASNPEKPIEWQHRTYKKNDPILFIDNDRFGDLLYNNLKGRIVNVASDETGIVFKIVVSKSINELEIQPWMKLNLISSSDGQSVIEFKVDAANEDNDEGDKSKYTLVPFQVAYAVSIHKAQGLEFDSVKIIIDSNVEDRIDRNIFYTAITRSKKYLHIFWSPESEHTIVDSFEADEHRQDLAIYKGLLKREGV